MKIGVIVASSNSAKNELLYNAVCKAAKKDDEVINFGVFEDDENFSYVEISLVIGMLLNRKIVDFVVTGCSSGQGMMLACNNMPGVVNLICKIHLMLFLTEILVLVTLKKMRNVNVMTRLY